MTDYSHITTGVLAVICVYMFRWYSKRFDRPRTPEEIEFKKNNSYSS